MTLYRVDSVFPMFTGKAEDIVMNTLHVESTQDDPELFALNAQVFMGAFWEDVYGSAGTGRVAYIDWQAMKLRCFDLSAPSPRIPYEAPGPFTTDGQSESVIPTEVACVASFQSQGLPGEVYQRRYNRIYLGMLTTQSITQGNAVNFPRISTTFTTSIITAMQNLAATLAGPDTLWVQVSNATAGGPRALPVIGGWVDNSPDTQRRRSVDSTARTNWSV